MNKFKLTVIALCVIVIGMGVNMYQSNKKIEDLSSKLKRTQETILVLNTKDMSTIVVMLDELGHKKIMESYLVDQLETLSYFNDSVIKPNKDSSKKQ